LRAPRSSIDIGLAVTTVEPVPTHANGRPVGLRIIVSYKFLRGALSILLALILAATAAEGWTDRLRDFARMLREHVVGAWSVRLADLLVRAATPRYLAIASVALAADGSLALFEGWALRKGFSWAPWLVVVATASLLPFEVYEIFMRARVGRVVVLIVNLAIVVYLYRREIRKR
jgi:uncharacterized membrane protein (DUF2068 family)